MASSPRPPGNDAAPDVINGDGDRTGYSVVEVGDNQAFADAKQKGAAALGLRLPDRAHDAYRLAGAAAGS